MINYCWNLLLPNLDNDLFNVCMHIASCAWQLKEYHYCFHKQRGKPRRLNGKSTRKLVTWAVWDCSGTEIPMKNKLKNKLFPSMFGNRSGKILMKRRDNKLPLGGAMQFYISQTVCKQGFYSLTGQHQEDDQFVVISDPFFPLMWR